jgi:hypothetical protein
VGRSAVSADSRSPYRRDRDVDGGLSGQWRARTKVLGLAYSGDQSQRTPQPQLAKKSAAEATVLSFPRSGHGLPAGSECRLRAEAFYFPAWPSGFSARPAYPQTYLERNLSKQRTHATAPRDSKKKPRRLQRGKSGIFVSAGPENPAGRWMKYIDEKFTQSLCALLDNGSAGPNTRCTRPLCRTSAAKI